MIEYFVFNGKNMVKYSQTRKEVMADIDWPLINNAGRYVFIKNNCLMDSIRDWLDLYHINFSINYFRWQDLYSDFSRIEPAFMESLLVKYQTRIHRD